MTIITRFAPSPTGPLHLGQAYSALVAHDAARAGGGSFKLRIDDIDPGRCRAAFRDAIDADLAWLGLLPDGPAVVQSARVADYAAALDRLREAGLLYACFCTRADIRDEAAASVAAPHGSDGPRYPGTCRALDAGLVAARIAAGAAHAWRLDMAHAVMRTGPLTWQDGTRGAVPADAARQGDVILARRDAPVSYHLASTLDDALMGVTDVARGADLLAATHIHRVLQALLGLATPRYHHHALVGDASGRRLAKRDGGAELAGLRGGGVEPEKLVAELRAGRLPLGYRWVNA